MDEGRRLRFLIPPCIMFGSVLLGVCLDPRLTVKNVVERIPPELLAGLGLPVLAGGGILLLATGYVIGTTSIVLLKILSLVVGKQQKRTWVYDINCRPGFLRRVARELKARPWMAISDPLSAGVTFDEEMLPPNVREWSMRRWHAFNTALHSCVALAYAVAICFRLGAATCPWIVISVLGMMVFGWIACTARRDTLQMADFHSRLPRDVRAGEAETKNGGAPPGPDDVPPAVECVSGQADARADPL